MFSMKVAPILEERSQVTTLPLTINEKIPVIGYFICLPFVVSWDHHPIIGLIKQTNDITSLLPFILSLSVASFGSCLSLLWWIQQWRFHPLKRSLSQYNQSWRLVASEIGTEFRRVDKFSSVIGGTSVYVTDSWIIQCSTYTASVIRQSNSHLSVVESEHHETSHESEHPTQFVKIMVHDINPNNSSFQIRLNSMEYNDLKDKLQAPLRNARNIVIHQSLSDQFLAEFIRLVQDNGTYSIAAEQELDSCIGCMQKIANIKLQKCCIDDQDKEKCSTCYCRPMWCVECMGKWFASRQNQRQPETWLSGKSPCPMCRAKFCMLDIVMVNR